LGLAPAVPVGDDTLGLAPAVPADDGVALAKGPGVENPP
jgi:hypothetical protein